MNRYILIFLMAFGLISCTDKNEQYYRSNPLELQKALKSCPSVKPEKMTCDALENIAKDMSSLAYQLQTSPQGFGSKIIRLQGMIAYQKVQLEKDKNNTELKEQINKNKNELMDLLSIVKWLESPES